MTAKQIGGLILLIIVGVMAALGLTDNLGIVTDVFQAVLPVLED